MSGRPGFEPAQQALTLYFRALAGRGCELVPYEDDADLWQHPDTASTVRLPARVSYPDGRRAGTGSRSPTGRCTTRWARSRSTWPRPSRSSPAAGPRCRRRMSLRWSGSPGCSAAPRSRSRSSRCWRTCGWTRPRLRLFAGLAPGYDRVRRAALADRPELAVLPPRAAVAEALVRFSLGAGTVLAPEAPARSTVDGRRGRPPAGRPAGDGGVDRGGGDPGLRGAGRAAQRGRASAPPGRSRSTRWTPTSTTRGCRAGHRTAAAGGRRRARRAAGAGALPRRARSAVRRPVRVRDAAAGGDPADDHCGHCGNCGHRRVPGRRRRRVPGAVTAGRARRGRRHRDRPAARAAPARPRAGPGRPARARARAPARPRPGRVRLPRVGLPSPAATWPTGAWCGSAGRRRSGPTAGTGGRWPGTATCCRGWCPSWSGSARPARLRCRRQPYGDDLDLDACVDALVDLRTGLPPPPPSSRRCGRSAGTSRSRSRSISARPRPSGCRPTRAGPGRSSGSSTCSGTR